jgi:hypothetical protein
MKNLHYYLPAFLFAVVAPLCVFVTYPDVQNWVAPDSVWRSQIVCSLVCLCGAVLFFLLLRAHLPAGLITSCLILGVFYQRYLFLFLVSSMVLASLLLSLMRKGFDLQVPHLASMAISIAVVSYIGFEYWQVVQAARIYQDVRMVEPIPIRISSPAGGERPDIYYIILDAYAGEELLRQLHDFDNSAFTSALEERGFVVTPQGKSNYLRTLHSLSSSLNMQYLDNVSSTMEDSSLWWPLQRIFAQNEIRTFLESQGYHTIVIASGWDFTSISDAETYLKPYPIMLNKFEEVFIGNTNLSLLGFLSRAGVSFPSHDVHRQTVRYAFEQLKKTPELDSPKFTFVHIISPHPPFVFDRDGNEITPNYPFTLADNRELIRPPAAYQRAYLEQLQFVNRQVLEAVDSILAQSSTPPVILIQGDHGPGIFLDAQSSSPPCFAERFSILNAYHLPGVDPAAIPPDITPVNTFRLIFNHYFSTDLALLPNHQYFSPVEAVHQFEDVTERTEATCVFPGSN